MNFSKALSVLAVVFLLSCSKDNNNDQSPLPVAETPEYTKKFTKNVLIEDYTGTWCGFCPRIAYSIIKVKENTTKAVSVAIHGGSRGSDPYIYSGTLPINISGYPTGKLNRLTDWTYPENSNILQPIALTSNNTDLGLAMTSTVASGNINLDVKVKFLKDYTNLKLVVYVVEDGLVYNQSNYTSFFGGASTLVNFVHDDVLRKCLTTSILGDVLTGTTTNATVTKNFNIAVPSNISDPTKMKFVAFVVDQTGNALNVRKSNPNENQSFQVNP
ncbi:Omp28-related outer membrane protein [Flavobacterium oreochromis]|uniref:Omp28-related outer membrane protein n=1 Tax=Flavobacterium oreochromis TaxID=2906078 RepID=UPI00385C151C